MRKAYSPHRGLGLVVLLLGAAGCGDTDERPVSWSYISAAIIQPNCATSRCHSEGSNAAGLVLDTIEGGYTVLEPYVVSDQGPDATSLMIRLNGGFPRLADVQRMPVDEPLPEADIDLIRRWIEAGAPNN
jgi:hypothetical protein